MFAWGNLTFHCFVVVLEMEKPIDIASYSKALAGFVVGHHGVQLEW